MPHSVTPGTQNGTASARNFSERFADLIGSFPFRYHRRILPLYIPLKPATNPRNACEAKGEILSEAKTNARVKMEAFEAIRLVIPKDHEVCRKHREDGPIMVHWRAIWHSVPATTRARCGPANGCSCREAFLTIIGVKDSMALLTVMFR